MGLFYKVSPKTLLEARNKIFIETAIPALQRNGFEKTPFTSSWFGRNNLNGFSYALCRVSNHSRMEFIETHISRGDKWIQIFLNVFELQPSVASVQQLQGMDGFQFHLPPNSITRMRLRIDDFKGMPLFRTKAHKLKRYCTKWGFNKRKAQLNKLIAADLNNIDHFVSRWHELHKPLITDWNGKEVDGNQP
ncbi:hypothetical protein MTO98_27930 [Mucilaginibacter sp. SMC90]|uniref:hypothetical protein n=1 Tax=Mucilaginibacter sp. SMC90 TaxID=2929803 RepID=UPI001FB506D2|nr:hypothetical protein [Mucilaginibacter sp. SMC90]UOE48242.1 hypothetical protein MTO98_27930 [Mucilaginibacter sp. SMC90]